MSPSCLPCMPAIGFAALHLRFAGCPAEIIGYAVWLYFRFPLSLRIVEEMLAARGIW